MYSFALFSSLSEEIGFVTEYASEAAYSEREKLFASIPELQQEDVFSYELVFMREPTLAFFRVGDTFVDTVQVKNDIPEKVNLLQPMKEKR